MPEFYPTGPSGAWPRLPLEVVDIFRLHGEDYRNQHPLSPEQKKAFTDMTRCRTAGLGGHVDTCDQDCGFTRISYNSCRNRHCPKCQNLNQAKWLQKRKDRLLPTPYFHMVITLPHDLNPLILQNKEVLYNLLFQTASQALQKLALEYPRLQAQLGFTAVLHTWDQDLQFHPHLHLVVTGGGLDSSAQHWVPAKNSFLVPVKALSQIVRGKFLDALKDTFHQGKLSFRGNTEGLKEESAFHRFLKKLRRQKWVVYSKKPFDGAPHVYAYLSRYTHRVAISNHRLVNCQDGHVTFKARNNQAPENPRQVTLPAEEFIRRFLLHVLPRGFVKIRHYGLLAPCNAKTKLEKARTLLQQKDLKDENHPIKETPSPTWQDLLYQLTGWNLKTCPLCKKGILIRKPLSLSFATTSLSPKQKDYLDSS
jgi:Putative transposase/Transposase zinc-binding domain